MDLVGRGLRHLAERVGNTSIEAEASGMATYAHELTHNLGLPDNYNNPFNTVQQVTATGMWDMMSRGSFNGPGGQHQRYLIPPTQGRRWARSTTCATSAS